MGAQWRDLYQRVFSCTVLSFYVVLEAKDSYYAQEQVAELEPTAATLQATNDFWNDWQAASDRHAWMQSVSNAALVIGAGLSAYAAVFGGS